MSLRVRSPGRRSALYCGKQFVYVENRRKCCSITCASRWNAALGKNVVRYWLGKKLPAHVVELHRKRMLGMKHSEEHKAKLRMARQQHGLVGEGHHEWK